MFPSRETLDQAVPHLLAAPKDGAEITRLCRRPDFGVREYLPEIPATVDGGIEGCRWAKNPWLKREDGSGDPRIQVSILQQRTLDLVWSGPDDDAIHPGDTCVVDMDLSEANLPVGTLLSAGTVILRVSDHFNDACVKWKVRYGEDALDWVRAKPEERRRGVLCEIARDGLLQQGAKLTKVSSL